MTFLFNNTTSYDGGTVDAFGRLRVVNPTSIAEGKIIYGDDPFIFINKTDGVYGSATFGTYSASMSLSSGTNINGYAIRQTRQYFQYVPGKSQLVFVTFVLGTAQTNCIKRVGLFDALNGFFLQQNGAALSVVKRTSVGDGIPDDIGVNQADWNIDTMLDGSGPSGITLDSTKAQILVIDFQWLGVGRVRMGFDIDGTVHYVHEFLHANVITSVYTIQPNLPVRWEIRNTDSLGASASLTAICFSVTSEGGYLESGNVWSINNTSKNATTGGTTILNVRLKNSYRTYPNRVSARFLTFSLMAITAPVLYKVAWLPSAASLDGTPSWSDVSPSTSHTAGNLSAMEYDTSATGWITAHNAESFISGYSFSSNQATGTVSPGIATANRNTLLGQNIDSDGSTVFSIWAQGIGGTASVSAAMTWIELL